jgi:enoyl-CoA hydratase/carnithine racemase
VDTHRGFDYRVADGVGTVTFTHPDTLNSLTFEVCAELERLAGSVSPTKRCASWCSPAPARPSARAATSNNEWGMDLVSAIEAEAQAQALLRMAEDHKEFYRAFTEKRPPRFTGR